MVSNTKTLLGDEYHGFILTEKIYEGGFGEIYRATPKDKSRSVAIKLIRTNVAHDESFQQRFLREIQILQKLDHPNIIPVLGFGYKNQHYYLVMPFIEGRDLHDLLNHKRFTPQDTWEFLEPIADALQSGHQQQIIHRDLKPENILIEYVDGKIKYYLSDFGLAKRPGVDSTITMQGKMLGTPEYFSPEYILNQDPLDARADLYSLTVMIYELLLGLVPFNDDSVHQIIMAHAWKIPPTPSSQRQDFPPHLEAFLMKNLEKDREKRHQSMQEYALAFEECLKQLTEEQRQTCYWVV